MRYPLMFIFCALSFFVAKAQDTRGLSVPKAAAKEEQSGTTYALVVGISNYSNVHPLQFADKDATMFRQYLMSNAGGNVKEDNILCLLNEQAKGASIVVRGMSWIGDRPYQKGDKLYIYLAGHGDAIDQDEYFFLGQDVTTGSDGAKNNYLAGNTLQMYNLKTRIGRINAKGVQVILIMDACRSDELSGGSTGQQMFATGITQNPRGEIMMLSASPGQSALESPSIGGGHGLFTYYLIDGLSGEADKDNDGKVDLYELGSYVKDKVRFEAKTKFANHEQLPYFCCSDAESRTVAKVDSDFHAQWIANRNMANTINAGSALAMNDGKGKRGLEGGETDTTLIKIYNEFNGAIKQERLLGDSSASFFYNTMKRSKPKASLTEDARYSLASEYLNFAQGKINVFLLGRDNGSEGIFKKLSATEAKSDDGENKNNLIKALPHRMAADMMDSAMVLLKDQPDLVKSLRPKYLFLRAYSYFYMQRYKEGLVIANDAIKLTPDAAYLYELRGDLEMADGQFSAAVGDANKAIALNANWAYPYLTIGLSYMQQAKYDSAITFIKTAMKIDAKCVHAYAAMGFIYCFKGRLDSAEHYITASITMDPTFINGYYLLGATYFQYKKIDKAQKWLEDFAKADPDNPITFNAYAVLGTISAQKNNIGEAEQYFKKSLSLNPSYVAGWALLGEVWQAKNNNDSAIINFRKSIALDSTNGFVWEELAVSFASVKNYPEALKCCEKALALNPKDVGSLYTTACIYSLLNDTKNAIYYLEESYKFGIEKGGNSFDHIQIDTDLNNIRTLPEFKALMKKQFPDLYKE